MSAPTHTPRPPANLPAREFQARAGRLLKLQAKARLDALMVFTPVNRFYLTGLEATNGLLLTEPRTAPLFLTDFRYLGMARRQAPWLRSKLLWRAELEADTLSRIGGKWRRVGYEGALGAERFLRLRSALPHVEWVDATRMLAELRAVKSPAEQRRLRAAIAANDALFAQLTRQCAPGMTEWEIRCRTRLLADGLGQGEAFDTIACAGRNAAECHHHPDTTPWRRNQPLLLDLGLRLDHYCSDMTRCIHPGAPDALWREIHAIVLRANRAAIEAIRPGVPCSEIDAIARRVIDQAGYGKYFGHSLGHGLGLEVHESPNLSSNCATRLKPGMVVTVEPGIYLPGRLGVRLEDVVLVKRTGCEVLTRTPHAW